ncbi:MAG: sensor histidine kinase [Lachnospiraceae bacterium]|nr:sensor histidine kinase [Lachnospiraceae bacterium]
MFIWAGDYLTNILSYFIVYRWIFRMPFRKNKPFCIGVVCTGVLLILGAKLTGLFEKDNMLVTILALLSILLLIEGNHMIALFRFPIAFFGAGVVNVLGSYFLAFLFQVPYGIFMRTKAWVLLAECFFPVVFFILFLLFKGLRKEADMVRFSIPQYLLALAGSLCMFIIVGISQGVVQGETQFSDWTRLFGICMASAGIVFSILIIWQSAVSKRALEYKMENEYYQFCLKRQEEHIKEIVENDQKIRRFRHDVNAHLTALEQCIQSNDQDQLKAYMDRLRVETKKLEVQKFTGLVAVDAIISEWHQKALEEGITWEWEGRFPEHTEIEAFDLCVLFSNLLSNAVEAARQVEEGREKKIQVSCGTFQEKICIRIVNTCKDDVNAKGILSTTKSDRQNHGFGMTNVQNTVGKLHGEFKKHADQGVFQVEIVL